MGAGAAGVPSSVGPCRFPRPGQVAQLVEQRTENPRVGGSIPSLATPTISITSRMRRRWPLLGAP